MILEKLSNKYLLLGIIGFYYFGIPLFEYVQMKSQEMTSLNSLVEDLESGGVRSIDIQQQVKQGVQQRRMILSYHSGETRQMIISNEMAVSDLVKRYSSSEVDIHYTNYVDIFTLWDNLIRQSLTVVFMCLNIYYLRQLFKQSVMMQSEGMNKSNEILNMGKSRAKLFNQ